MLQIEKLSASEYKSSLKIEKPVVKSSLDDIIGLGLAIHGIVLTSEGKHYPILQITDGNDPSDVKSVRPMGNAKRQLLASGTIGPAVSHLQEVGVDLILFVDGDAAEEPSLDLSTARKLMIEKRALLDGKSSPVEENSSPVDENVSPEEENPVDQPIEEEKSSPVGKKSGDSASKSSTTAKKGA